MTTDKTPAPLATAKHGGCVQLPTSEHERFEAWGRAEGLPLARGKLGGYAFEITAKAWLAWQYLSAHPSPGSQIARSQFEEYRGGDCERDAQGYYTNARTTQDWAMWQAALAARQPVGEPVGEECQGCNGGIRYDAEGCSCTSCGKRPKWYMAGRRIRVTERRKPWKHLGTPAPFEAECTWQMGDSIDYRLDGETTSRRLNNFHQHWERVEVIQ